MRFVACGLWPVYGKGRVVITTTSVTETEMLMTSVASFPFFVVCNHHSLVCLKMCRRRDRRDQIHRDVRDSYRRRRLGCSIQQRSRNVSLGHIIGRLLDLLCVFWPLRSSRTVFSIDYRRRIGYSYTDRVDNHRSLAASKGCLEPLVFLKGERHLPVRILVLHMARHL